MWPKSQLICLQHHVKENNDVEISFDKKNIIFKLSEYLMICRQIEARFPNYNGVIPQNNPFKLIVDRVVMLNALRRVSVFSNQGTGLVKLSIKTNEILLSAQDIDFSISAEEKIACQYEGENINIGFKAPFLIDILNNISSSDIIIELADPSRAGVILPLENEPNEELMTADNADADKRLTTVSLTMKPAIIAKLKANSLLFFKQRDSNAHKFDFRTCGGIFLY